MILKNKIKILSFVFLVLSLKVNAQNNTIIDSVLYAFKNYKIEKAKLLTKKTPNEYKKIFINQIGYIQNGIQLDTTILADNIKTEKYVIVKSIFKGDCFFNKGKSNYINSHKEYKTAYLISQKLKDTLLQNICIAKLCKIQSKLNDEILLKIYLDKLFKIKKDKIDNFWYEYYKNYYELLKNYKNKKTEHKLNFNKGYLYAKNNKYLTTKYKLIEAFYLEHFLNEQNLSKELNIKTLSSIKKENDYLFKKEKTVINLNLAILLFNTKKYNLAIKKFKKPLNFLKNDMDNNWKINEWISKCFEGLKKYDSAYFYIKKTNILINKLDKKEISKKLINLERKQELKQKQTQLEKQIKKANTLNTKMNTILPILGIITLLLGFVFILYKKYYKKTENLEEEKFETIKKIDQLKKIVIKNHIILKDKTKVYIADLTYIKSDDHYLKVFLSNGKSHFVRGKLNKIVEELPPNFIRCHRSYVVNRNFIKQINNTNIVLVDKTEIPLSRSYKDKL